ncbi:MAG: antibiotic biosynthesis monooxygenase [Planctomycetales bacterium]|nr:antibiotic biosynthesis monooxygenase [Planctomycetales bacterium]
MPAAKCAVHVVFRIKSENFQEFLDVVKAQANNSLTREPWCQQFDVCVSPDTPDTVMLYETYDDRESFAKHRQTSHLAEFNQACAGWVVTRDVTIWDIVSG